jgi:ferredoxin
MIVDWETCIGCGLCVEACPLQAVLLAPEKKASISGLCVECKACTKVCPKDAIRPGPEAGEGRVECSSCPICCLIPVGKTGACQRFVNLEGNLVRNIPLQGYEDVQELVGEDHEEIIRKPMIQASEPAPRTRTPGPLLISFNPRETGSTWSRWLPKRP